MISQATKRWILSLAALAVLPAIASAQGRGGGGENPNAVRNQIEDLYRRLSEMESIPRVSPELMVSPPPVEGTLPLSFVEEMRWRSIGAVNMGGRITALAVVESNPKTFYAATASGGLLRTTNNGTTFDHLFDFESAVSLGEVAVSQSDPTIVWVGTGEENPRNSVSYGNGVYKSTDSGETWEHMGLTHSFHIGSIAIHPTNPDIVYVGALGRLYGNNPERGLYKTTDGGQTWTQVLYVDQITGVIDIDMHPEDPDTLLVAMYERQRTDGTDGGEPNHRNGPGSGIYKTTDGGQTFEEIVEGLPVGNMGRSGIDYYLANPDIVMMLTESADREENGVYRSEDGGETWRKVSDTNPRPMYFSQLRIDPNDDNVVWVCGVSLSRSTDGGVTFSNDEVNNELHPDQHALWIDPYDSDHIILGCDGGVYMSYDSMENTEQFNNMALGQYYHVGVSANKDYWAYGGLQDNGSWGIPAHTRDGRGPMKEDAVFLIGGDGFVCRVDPNDPYTVYAESQGGNIRRIDMRTGATTRVQTIGRGNWETPYILSHHNPGVLYNGTATVNRSLDRGDNAVAISPELGLRERGTATDLAESPINPAVLWVGTDDGAVWVTRNGGVEWTELHENLPDLPGPRWVASVEASRFAEGRCYVVLDAHRSNDDNPYVYVTEDFGETWTSINNNLPAWGSTRVLREDVENENLLYVGTEFAAFASIDRGATWTKLNGDTLPTVAVHDFAIHPSMGEIVVATHGRSLWVLDVKTLRQMSEETLAEEVKLYEPNLAIRWDRAQGPYYPYGHGIQRFYGENRPAGAQIYYHLNGPASEVTLKVYGPTGEMLRELETSSASGESEESSESVELGLHRASWNLTVAPPETSDNGGGRGGRGGQRGQGGGGQRGQGGGQRGQRGQRGGGQRGQRGGQRGGRGGRGRRGGGGVPVPTGIYKIVLTVDDQELSTTVRVEPDPGKDG